MSITEQLDRLVELGVPRLAGVDEDRFRSYADGFADGIAGGTLVVHPSLVPAAELATLLRRAERPGFVVVDLTDLAQFAPVAGVVVPDAPLYLLRDIERGDEMANWSRTRRCRRSSNGDARP